ncbi:hypothetical protein M407DRAFT_47353, partial [Tulasnella calospora MUT 4182]
NKWNTPHGHFIIQKIVKKRCPDWQDGLRAWQLPIVAQILDGQHTVNITATGDGKALSST